MQSQTAHSLDVCGLLCGLAIGDQQSDSCLMCTGLFGLVDLPVISFILILNTLVLEADDNKMF